MTRRIYTLLAFIGLISVLGLVSLLSFFQPNLALPIFQPHNILLIVVRGEKENSCDFIELDYEQNTLQTLAHLGSCVSMPGVRPLSNGRFLYSYKYNFDSVGSTQLFDGQRFRDVSPSMIHNTEGAIVSPKDEFFAAMVCRTPALGLVVAYGVFNVKTGEEVGRLGDGNTIVGCGPFQSNTLDVMISDGRIWRLKSGPLTSEICISQTDCTSYNPDRLNRSSERFRITIERETILHITDQATGDQRIYPMQQPILATSW